MLRFASLGSGSKGNGTLIESGKTRILLDCGFSLGETELRLHRLGCPLIVQMLQRLDALQIKGMELLGVNCVN